MRFRNFFCRRNRGRALLLYVFLSFTWVRVSPATDLVVRSWSQGADVRQRSVNALLQTRDGYLWVGTGKGLLRFDGVAFTAFTADNTPGMVDDDIALFSLWEDGTGALWAGTESRGVIRDDHGHFSTLGKEQGLRGGRVLRIDGDETGAVWIYTNAGVSQWRGGDLKEMHPEQDGSAASVLIPRDDRRTPDFETLGLWRHTASGIERFSYGHWNQFPTPPGEDRPFEKDVSSIYEDTSHRVWYSVGSQLGRYFRVQNGTLRMYEGLPKGSFVSYEDTAGFLWFNLHSAHPARWRQGKVLPLTDMHTPWLLRVVEQADGSIWAGSPGTALFQYLPQRISSLPTSGIPEVVSVLFRQRNGDVWAGGTDLLRLQPGKDGPSLQPLFAGKRHWSLIYALSEDPNGNLLISSRNHLGIETLRHGHPVPYLRGDFDTSVVHTMLLSASGDQWIGTATGLYRYGKGSGARVELLWRGDVRCLVEAGPHTVWVGTATGPLRFEDGRLQPLGARSSWRFGAVQSISADRTGEVWMATLEDGVIRLSGGNLQAFGTTDGLPTRVIYSVDVGDEDDLWLRSNVGLIRVRKQSMEQRLSDPATKLRVTLFDQAEGLPATDMREAANQGFLRLDRSTFWFATPAGIASLHPSDFRSSATSPHAKLEEHTIDQSIRMPASRIVLRPGQSNLELHYTALGSKSPEQVNFRYRLRGYDKEWIAAGTRRVAYYTHLPPGAYTFEVQAADEDGEAWEAVGASADVRVLTPFYRTWWMKTLLCLLLLGGLSSFVWTRRRINMERSRMRQTFTHKLIETQEGERKRIAHELHDSLGQHLALIRTLALLPIARVGAAGDHLAKIADQSAVAIQEVESISYDLRPYQLDRLGLTTAILSLLEHFEESSAARMTHSIENIDGFFAKNLEINVYRIVQEALANVLKHAAAKEVTVTVSQTGNSLRLMVTDNGRGFTGSTGGAGSSGLGLIGIQERAEALGGQAAIESAEGQGTKVIVTVTRTG